jgi:type IV pilus assembly protein PilA
MLARMQKSMKEKDQGFTLIELLVVIIIIGILAAIAIPVFLNQRKKAVDASMKSDLKTVANAEETYFTDNQAYLAVASTATPTVGDAVTLSNGNLAAVTLGSAAGNTGAYCVAITRASSAQAGGRTSWVYQSNAGGIQSATTATCTGF